MASGMHEGGKHSKKPKRFVESDDDEEDAEQVREQNSTERSKHDADVDDEEQDGSQKKPAEKEGSTDNILDSDDEMPKDDDGTSDRYAQKCLLTCKSFFLYSSFIARLLFPLFDFYTGVRLCPIST